MSHKRKNKKTITTFEGQHQGEVVQLVFRRHIVVLRHALIYFMLAILAGTLVMTWRATDSLFYVYPFVGMFFGGLIFWYNWIGWHYSVFIVTDSRFIQIKQKGFLTGRLLTWAWVKYKTLTIRSTAYSKLC